jgi:hypothetical protein
MGATGYFNTTHQHTSAEAAFRDLQCIIGSEDGSGLYAGNISIVPGFSVVKRTPLTEWEASNHASTRYDHMDKWGAGEAVPLLPKDVKTSTRTLRINITDAHKAALDSGASWFNENDAAAKVVQSKLRAGERIVRIWVTESQPVWKPVVKKATGKATRSFVLSVHGRESRFATLAEAVEASKNYATRQSSSTSLTIREEVLRDEQPRATVESTLVKHMVTVAVTIVKPTDKQAATIGGWAFYGMAPC